MARRTLYIGLALIGLAFVDVRAVAVSESDAAGDARTSTGQTIGLRVGHMMMHPDGSVWAPGGAWFGLGPAFRSAVLWSSSPDSCLMNYNAVYSDRPNGSEELARTTAGASFTWIVEARLLHWDGTSATLDIRQVRSGRGWSFQWPDGDSVQRVKLREGEHRVVGQMTPLSPRDCSAEQVDITLELKEPEHVESAALAYDIWLLKHDPDGSVQTRRFQTSGLQGREVPFGFEPFYSDETGMPLREGTSVDAVRTTVTGSIRGRALEDGRVSLRVGALRTVFRSPLGVGDGGGKEFTVAPGDTVELPLPGLSGHASLPGVQLERVAADDSMAVRVTTRRIR